MKTKLIETHRDNTFIYYDNYIEENDSLRFNCKCMKLRPEIYDKKFGVLDNPLLKIKKDYQWDIPKAKWEDLVNIYEDDVYSLVWDLYEMTPEPEHVSLAVDILLKNIKISNHLVKEYIYKLTSKEFTKQDGKDILNRLQNNEDPTKVYSDNKYKKLDSITTIVENIFIEHKDKIDGSNNKKIASWLVGQVMKKTNGKCDPIEVKTIIDKLVNNCV
jgi:Glu-tRNA(Gln) amidotransferase subunit E-like FAD-binding protein